MFDEIFPFEHLQRVAYFIPTLFNFPCRQPPVPDVFLCVGCVWISLHVAQDLQRNFQNLDLILVQLSTS